MNQVNVVIQNRLISVIEEIIYNGGEHNFAIIQLNEDYYIQIAASRGDYEMYCEAVGNEYLEEETYLTEEQVVNLIKLKWELPVESISNYNQIHKVDSERSREELAELIIETSNKVYMIKEIDIEKIDINLE